MQEKKSGKGSSVRIPELLVPAGNYEKLVTATHYGADAVYLGGKRYSLRAKAGNFSSEDMARGIAYAHQHGVKVYVTINILAHNDDLEGLADYLREVRDLGADAIIVSDPGILREARQSVPELPIHLSTQANVTNHASARFWLDQGACRLNLARELSLAEIREIRAAGAGRAGDFRAWRSLHLLFGPLHALELHDRPRRQSGQLRPSLPLQLHAVGRKAAGPVFPGGGR